MIEDNYASMAELAKLHGIKVGRTCAPQMLGQPTEYPRLGVETKTQGTLMVDVAFERLLERVLGSGGTHGAPAAADVAEVLGTASATSRSASVSSRRYVLVLERSRCPIRSPIALIPTPRPKSRIAKECRSA